MVFFEFTFPAIGLDLTKLRIRNMNITMFLESPSGFEKFLRVIPLLIARLGLSSGSLIVHAVLEGEPQPRNLPPPTFYPPQLPPNNWLNRTVAVFLAGVGGVAPPVCSAVQTYVGVALAQGGFDMLWESCASLKRTKAPDLYKSFVLILTTRSYLTLLSLASGTSGFYRVDWSRSDSDFNHAMVPAIVIAVILLACGLLVALCTCCCRRRRESRRQQRFVPIHLSLSLSLSLNVDLLTPGKCLLQIGSRERVPILCARAGARPAPVASDRHHGGLASHPTPASPFPLHI
jgi:hypothetical protein